MVFVKRNRFAVKITKRALAVLEIKLKLIGVKGLEFVASALILTVYAVFSVTYKRMSDVRHVGSYLMRAPRHKLNLNKAFAVFNA